MYQNCWAIWRFFNAKLMLLLHKTSSYIRTVASINKQYLHAHFRFCQQFKIFCTGGVGTKRFCSAVDLGNRCDYGGLPGDQLEYRTCVYTCSSDGCNPATTILPNAFTFTISSFIILYILLR